MPRRYSTNIGRLDIENSIKNLAGERKSAPGVTYKQEGLYGLHVHLL